MSAERAAFMPMGDSSDFLPKKAEKGAGAGGSKRKTTRLALDLFEPDENSFPEFNYAKLVQIEKVKFFLMDFFFSSLSLSSASSFCCYWAICANGAKKKSPKKKEKKESIFLPSSSVAYTFCCCDSSHESNAASSQRIQQRISFINRVSTLFFLQKKQKILSKLPNGNNTAGDKHDDPFANDDHDDIAKITRELEAKYVSLWAMRSFEFYLPIIYILFRAMEVHTVNRPKRLSLIGVPAMTYPTRSSMILKL